MEKEFYTKGRACAKAQKKEAEELYWAQVERNFWGMSKSLDFMLSKGQPLKDLSKFKQICIPKDHFDLLYHEL